MTHRFRALVLELLEPRMLLARDFGDAPAPYATTSAEYGAQHEAIGPMLGATRDAEVDATHSAAASSDGADEDGVMFGSMRVGQLGVPITVTVSNAPSGAKLDAWIDFNNDGSWGGAGEHFLKNRAVVNGPNVFRIDVPSTTPSGTIIARFRISTAGNLRYYGPAADGEVEDYAIVVAPPVASSGQFSIGKTIAFSLAQLYSVFAADVDRDGDMDVLSASQDGKLAWHENNGSQGFAERVIATGNQPRAVIATDLDLDGDIDVVMGSFDTGGISWYENNGSQAFAKRVVSNNSPVVKNLSVADVDGDGDMDVVAAYAGFLAWYENNGSQTFTRRLLEENVIPPVDVLLPFDVKAVDLDGDADIDILYCSAGTDNLVGWFENNGAQFFTHRPISTVTEGGRTVHAVDFDGDGRLDVYVSTDNGGKWFQNDGFRNFVPKSVTDDPADQWGAIPADFDGDGDADALYSQYADNKLLLGVNNGAGAFATRTVSTAASFARGVFAADIDGDGDLDGLVAGLASNRIIWFENRVIDFDGDRDADGGDFLVWQRSVGKTAMPSGSGADANADGKVDAVDLALWRGSYGFVPAVAAAIQGGAAARSEASRSASGAASVESAGARGAPLFAASVFLAPDLFATAESAPGESQGPATVEPTALRWDAARDAAFAASDHDAVFTRRSVRRARAAAAIVAEPIPIGASVFPGIGDSGLTRRGE